MWSLVSWSVDSRPRSRMAAKMIPSSAAEWAVRTARRKSNRSSNAWTASGSRSVLRSACSRRSASSARNAWWMSYHPRSGPSAGSVIPASSEVGTAVDGNRRAGDEAGRLGAKEDGHRRHLLGQPDAAEVVLGAEVADDRRIGRLERPFGQPGGVRLGEVLLHRVGHHRARAHRVHENAFRCEGAREVL